MPNILPILVVVGVLAFVLLGVITLVSRFYRQVDQGKALIINTLRSEPVVTFTGAVVYPVINRAEVMDMSVKIIEIDRRGKEGLICKDNIRADINVNFFVRVNKTEEDVLKVAQSIGCQRASDPATLSSLFAAKFSEALKTVGKHFDFQELYKMREEFKDQIIKVIGKDLNGYILDDAAIDYLEQTPLESLDRNNIMDAEGIRKITDLTVVQNLQTNELRQKERMETGSQNLNADEAIFRFEQRRAEAEAKKNKEIAVAQAREENEGARIASEEQKKTALVYEKNQEEALVAAETKTRGVAIAQKNREREIGVEEERVQKARQLEAIQREREVALVSIAKEKDVEVEKKAIADVIRARIAVDKTVATEEESIKDLRTVAQATREKDVIRLAAEARAEEIRVRTVKSAEAEEEAAKFEARKRVLLADAELETADKTARAKQRLAEGIQAEEAASGLAKARVREAEAVAIEKTGQAEASALRERMVAEAEGLTQKANAMHALDAAGRGHEEFRLQIEKEKAVDLRALDVKKELAVAQAEVLGKTLGNAKIQIMGGDGQFLERFVKAVSVGQSIDAFVDESKTVQGMLAEVVKEGSPAAKKVAEVLRTVAEADPKLRAKLGETPADR